MSCFHLLISVTNKKSNSNAVKPPKTYRYAYNLTNLRLFFSNSVCLADKYRYVPISIGPSINMPGKKTTKTFLWFFN